MQIPPQIQIAGTVYDINFREEPIKSEKTGQDMVARVVFRDSLIEIYSQLGSQITDTSILHELQHAIFFAMGYSGDVTVILDESFVERSAHLWNQVIQQIIEYNQKHD